MEASKNKRFISYHSEKQNLIKGTFHTISKVKHIEFLLLPNYDKKIGDIHSQGFTLMTNHNFLINSAWVCFSNKLEWKTNKGIHWMMALFVSNTIAIYHHQRPIWIQVCFLYEHNLRQAILSTKSLFFIRHNTVK